MNEDYISLKEAAEILGKSVPATRATIKRHGVQTISVHGKHGIELRVHVEGLETLRDNARTAAKSTVGTSDTSKGTKQPRKGAQTENSDKNSVNPWEELAQARAKLERLEAIIEAKDAQLDEAHRDYRTIIGNMTAAFNARSAAEPQPKAIEAPKPKPWWNQIFKRD
jgi:hypothetical protein